MKSRKKRLTAFWLCLTLGPLGAHRFYVGRYISGFIMLISLGGLLIWAILDLIRIIFGQFRDEDGLKVKIWAEKNPGIKILLSLVLIHSSLDASHKFNIVNQNKSST